MVARESTFGIDEVSGPDESGCAAGNGSSGGKRCIVADKVPVVRVGAIVVAKVFDGANGTP